MHTPLAIVTGASSGIGYELAKLCAAQGCSLIVVADEAAIHDVGETLRSTGVAIKTLQTDLATREGNDAVIEAAAGRPIDYLLANAGHGLGRDFLSQEFAEIRHVIDTNITGTVYLIQLVAREMRARGQGRILVTGSIAGYMPGSFQAVYNGTKAFIDSFSFAIREELKDTGITVTCLMPGATDTNFFERADMMDTKVGTDSKDAPATVAKDGFDAMMAGQGDVVSSWKNKIQTAVASVTPSGVLARQHRSLAEPGTAKKNE